MADQINVEELYQHRFREGTEKRSDAYKAGYRAGLERLNGPNEKPLFIPYSAGAAEFDAWFSGYDHAHEAVLRQLDEARASLNGGW